MRRLRQPDLDERQHMLVDHIHIEFEKIAYQRAGAYEIEKLLEDLADRQLVFDIGLSKLMNFHRVELDRRFGTDQRLETLGEHDLVSSDQDGRDGDDIVPANIQARRFAVEGDDLVRRRLLEQKAVGLIANRRHVEIAPDHLINHQQIPEIEAMAHQFAELADNSGCVTEDIAVGRRQRVHIHDKFAREDCRCGAP